MKPLKRIRTRKLASEICAKRWHRWSMSISRPPNGTWVLGYSREVFGNPGWDVVFHVRDGFFTRGDFVIGKSTITHYVILPEEVRASKR
jgi:hypothetical protein